MFDAISRRGLFAGALVGPLANSLVGSTPASPADNRTQAALLLRQRAALLQSKRPLAAMKANGDETAIPNWAACYSKGLPQNGFGEVDPAAYKTLLTAVNSGKHADFERIARSGGRKLNNPQAAFTYQVEGGDPHSFELPPAPSVTSEEAAVETSELYWQALCRDVPFSSYDTSPVVQQAAKHLGATGGTIFRGPTKGDAEGPYVSQFLLKPIPYGSGKIEQRYRVPSPNSDFLTSVSEWSQIQTGILPWLQVPYDPKSRYIRNGRDLAEYVHYDFTCQAYLNAALILFNGGPDTILNCNPFKSPNNPYRYSTVEEGFITFGLAELTDWLGRVTNAALKASYFQKWMVHRRLRPEELGGRIHQARIGKRDYPINPALLKSPAVDATFFKTRTYLLPQAYPEGCPLHPSYPAGHAAIAGACSVILKVCFDESMLLPGCVVPDSDGLSLEPCSGFAPTIGAEINKLASNISLARDWAGIHYRSDGIAGIELGESVAVSVLQDLVRTYTEGIKGLTFTRFNGTKVFITTDGEVKTA
jgi:hypothetical protein